MRFLFLCMNRLTEESQVVKDLLLWLLLVNHSYTPPMPKGELLYQRGSTLSLQRPKQLLLAECHQSKKEILLSLLKEKYLTFMILFYLTLFHRSQLQ